MTETTYPTTCWECSTCCGALATVRDGRVVDFAPNRDHPYSKGAFCIKGIRGAPGITYGANRLLHPMRRTGARGEGKWARVSWDEALDEMADGLARVRQKYGPEAIVGATSGAYFSRSVILALTLRSIGSPNWMINQDLCGGCRAVSARVMGLDITRGEDIDNTRCALIVGRNPSIADPVEWAALKAAKKRGARIIVVDPKRTQAAQMADLWLAPTVGTDAALALAMMHVLIAEDLYDKAFVARWCHGFDAAGRAGRAVSAGRSPQRLTGVPAEQIVAAARMYADGPSTFVSGHGIDAFSAGVQTFRAYHCLVAISGNVDRPGGNLRLRTPTRLPQLHRSPAHAGVPPRRRDRAAHHRRRPLPAVGRAQGLADGLPQPLRHRGHAHGPPLSRARALCQRRQHPRHLSRHAPHHGGAALARLRGGGGARHDADGGVRRHRAAQDHHARGGGGLVHALRPDRALHARRRAAAGRGALARSTSPCRCSPRWRERQAVTRHLLPWRSQREFNTYLLGDSGIRIEDLERTGYSQVSAEPRGGPAVRDADRQDRAVLHHHGRASGSIRCRPTIRRAASACPRSRPGAIR